jgi:23S rRNA (cytosine1962-C5)-methyltransferase
VTIDVLTCDWPEYELLDCGGQRKLERFGDRLVVRGEPKAWWRQTLSEQRWQEAWAVHDEASGWSFPRQTGRQWPLRFGPLTVEARITGGSKHLGVFPEQSAHWRFILERPLPKGDEPPRLLNLFGYTGVASLAAAARGFHVTHVDASKPALGWAKRNRELSGLPEERLRFLLDDAGKFVRREIRRGRRYEALLLDPPSFGRGPGREVWKVERQLPELLADCARLLSERALFAILTMYNIEASALTAGNLLTEALAGRSGGVRVGELAVRQAGTKRLLPRSIFALWEG